MAKSQVCYFIAMHLLSGGDHVQSLRLSLLERQKGARQIQNLRSWCPGSLATAQEETTIVMFIRDSPSQNMASTLPLSNEPKPQIIMK